MAQTKMGVFYNPRTNGILKIVLPHGDGELSIHLEPGQAMLELDRKTYAKSGPTVWASLINAANPQAAGKK
jgi:hypothetical protein